MGQWNEGADRDQDRRGGEDRRGRADAPGPGPRHDQEAWNAREGETRDHLDSGAGDQGEDRYGHSGGFQSGYGGQSGKAAWGPLSRGSTYGQGGPGFGHSSWASRPNASEGPRGQGRGAGGDYGFRGQGGGGQQWGERSGGSYGQGDYGEAARRSQARREQHGPGEREGFVAYGRAYGDARRDAEGEHEHDHEPGYRDWREHQLSGHDRDYQRWRDEQARRYDEEYKGYRTSRHEAFSRGFDDWRTGRNAQGGAGVQGGGAPLDQAVGQVGDVADGGSGRVQAADDKAAADKQGERQEDKPQT